MEVTDIKIRKINLESKMKAIVSVTFDHAFVVHDMKVIEGKNKLFVAMPSRKTAEGDYKDIAHPINVDMRKELETMILNRFQVAVFEEMHQTE